MLAVEIFTVSPSRFPEKISDLDAENFESHVFEGYYLKVMKKLTYVNRAGGTDRMRNVTVAAVQMKCSKSVEKNIAHAEELVVRQQQRELSCSSAGAF